MAALGHLAVGLAVGQGVSRVHPASRRIRVVTMSVWLATLPDIDSYLGFVGIEHRGPTHSVGFVVAIAVLAALIARLAAWPVLPSVLLTVAAVGSHIVVDMLGPGSAMPLFWPISSAMIDPLPILTAPSWTTEFRFEMLWSMPFLAVGAWPILARVADGLRRGRAGDT
jgi:inner membrane protein